MIRVFVELVPFGNPAEAEILYEIDIINVTRKMRGEGNHEIIADYSVEIRNCQEEVEPTFKTMVCSFPRELGVLKLLEYALQEEWGAAGVDMKLGDMYDL